MRLTRIELENVRRFRGPIVIEGLDPGLNLFTGVNGAGKSTLVAAIRAAFFERYKTSSVTLQPLDDHSASPRVTVAFDVGDTHYELTKQFLAHKRCSLHAGGQVLDGESAEEHLSDLLGYSYAGRGGSKAEHWGIPGLLWIEQGAGQELAEAVDYAGDRLQNALLAMAGAVASTEGDAVINALRLQRSELVTDANQNPRGPYQEAKRDLTTLTAEAEELQSRLDLYQQDVDRLGGDTARLAQLDAEKPWVGFYRQADLAKQQIEAAHGLRNDLRNAQREQEDANKLSEMHRDRLEALAAPERDLPQASADLLAQSDLLRQAEERQQLAGQAFTEAENELAEARSTLIASRQQSRRLDLRAQSIDLEKRVQRQTQALQEGREHGRQRLAHQETIAITELPNGALERLRGLAQDQRDRQLQVNTIGTRIDYTIDKGAQITLDAAPLTGAGIVVIDRVSRLQVPGGELVLTPGGDDLPRLLAERDDLEARLTAALRDLGVADLAEAEDRAARHAKAVNADRFIEAQLRVIAPEGIDELERELAGIQAQLKAATDELATIPDAPDDTLLPDVEGAERRHEDASLLRDERLEDRSHASNQLNLARGHCDSASQRVKALQSQLEDPERENEQRTVRDQLNETAGRRTEAQALAARLKEQLDVLNIPQLEQDERRLRQSARQEEDRHRSLRDAIIQLRTRVQHVGGEGLGEHLAGVTLRRTKAARRVDEYTRKVEVLNYLLAELELRRDRIRQTLMAPLQTRIDHYLRMLMPDARLQMADTMAPEKLLAASDGRTRGDFDMQSFGTREQLALICRLAYADLLQEAGLPTLLILDDALVHTDDGRLGAMKRVLYDAAERHQVLMMTCHPERWRDLGARTTAMTDLTTA
ncbi:AAA family ATPase [Lysobacter sp. Root983]|uniref:AAA family ATPase n=1 Tax=Lysobacter sp. Root983 TaxID=1736613 RepID=UPI00070F4722|nr:AAA family ATPase [Lysobacter sp. Root983]KRD79730.1 hypothetical protein ASE43_02180 [Lysobacter sp. Root983]